MNHHYQIIPECYADTVLVEVLGFEKPNHQLGIGKVFASMSKTLEKRPTVGIIDNDKVKPKALDEFEPKGENHGIKRFSNGKHTILVISPAFEDWVFENAQSKEIDPAEYGFTSRKAFRDASKSTKANQNQHLKQFLNTLKQKKAPGFVQLTDWICEATGIDKADI
ncbi:MAG: hypothetical protein ABMA02_12730 [Saprospiraceae bacterium]